jgi:hypothetical protein
VGAMDGPSKTMEEMVLGENVRLEKKNRMKSVYGYI